MAKNKDIILSWKAVRNAFNKILDNISLASMFIIVGIDIAISYAGGDVLAPYALGLAIATFVITMIVENKLASWHQIPNDKKLWRVITLASLCSLTLLPGIAIATIILGTIGVVKLGRKL